VFLYRLSVASALALYGPYRVLIRRRKLAELPMRLFGRGYPSGPPSVWVHAVSVGEVGVARALLAEISRRRPEFAHVLSSTTEAGLALARRQEGGNATVVPFPLDFARPVDNALAALQPVLIVLTESEIWPLFLERAAHRGVPVALANGKLSERSFRRWRSWQGLAGQPLSKIARFAVQDQASAERFLRLGVPEDRVAVTGNIKFDRPADAGPGALAARIRSLAGERTVWIAGSTAPGEEKIVLDAWSALSEPKPLLLIAPRRPERFDEAAALVERRGIRLQRRSRLDREVSAGISSVLLLDTIGELSSLYTAADFAFIGGSLVPRGGQSPVEAWAAGVPVLIGPLTEKVTAIVAAGREAGIAVTVRNAKEMAAQIEHWRARPEQRGRLAAEARQFVERNRGATSRTSDFLMPLLEPPMAAAGP
jgi:3-deoxy-D-manno-octulosonic-acid transferase